MTWSADEHYKSHKVASEYDKSRFSSIPGRLFNHLEKRVILKCFSGVAKGKTIADAPCGTGRLADVLLASGYRVHGIDISEAMLRVAEQRLHTYGAGFTHEVLDVKRLPSGTPTYDAALCARVLMHFKLDQQIEFLAGVARLSRSIVVINHSLDSAYQRFRRRLKQSLSRQEPARCPISNASIKHLLEQAGLREVKRYRLFPLISEAVYIVAEKGRASAEAT
ncbi:MAG: class I SAM-dependent methyltransferase [Acidobacteriaceae bacterium]